jgi:tRNA dimethylallyltransferase
MLSLDRIGNARAVLIAGPTASGKSAAALALAEAARQGGRNAWIVNADSMQVYDALHVVTARPSAADEARAPHRLYGHASAGTRYSVGVWLRDMREVLEEAAKADALVIAAGGTGLYFKALTEGLAAIPPVPAAHRRQLSELLAERGVAFLHERLRGCDPAAAEALRPGDPQRVLRALEVFEGTGRSILEWQRMRAAPPLLPAEATARFVIETPRPVLYERIENRFTAMVEAGALEEVAALLRRKLDPDLPVMKAIGVRAFAAHLDGAATLDDAVAAAKMESRRYAKRQTTWFRQQMRDWTRIGN